ncbi:MAG: hypothetical protein V3T31_00110 [candidate division Zixibacteria bacterium]
MSEMLAESVVDIYVAYKFVKILSQPWKDTDAFKLGIIDEKGKVLIKRRNLKTGEQKAAYTIFHTLIWNIKRILDKLPPTRTRIGSFAAALWMLKEYTSPRVENENLIEQTFVSYLLETSQISMTEVMDYCFEEYLDEAFKAPPKGTIAKAEKTQFGFQVLVWSFDDWHPDGKPRSSMAKAQADAKKINADHKKRMNEANEVPDFRPEQPSILFKGRYKLLNDLDDRDGGQGRKGNIVMARKDTQSFDTLLGQPMFKVKIEKSLKDLVVSYEDLEQV